jgi:hypothetical protein
MENKKTKSLFKMQIESSKEAHKLSVGLGMVGISTDIPSCDLIVETLKAMNKYKGSFSISHAVNIKIANDEKHQKISDEYKAQ